MAAEPGNGGPTAPAGAPQQKVSTAQISALAEQFLVEAIRSRKETGFPRDSDDAIVERVLKQIQELSGAKVFPDLRTLPTPGGWRAPHELPLAEPQPAEVQPWMLGSSAEADSSRPHDDGVDVSGAEVGLGVRDQSATDTGLFPPLPSDLLALRTWGFEEDDELLGGVALVPPEGNPSCGTVSEEMLMLSGHPDSRSGLQQELLLAGPAIDFLVDDCDVSIPNNNVDNGGAELSEREEEEDEEKEAPDNRDDEMRQSILQLTKRARE